MAARGQRLDEVIAVESAASATVRAAVSSYCHRIGIVGGRGGGGGVAAVPNAPEAPSPFPLRRVGVRYRGRTAAEMRS